MSCCYVICVYFSCISVLCYMLDHIGKNRNFVTFRYPVLHVVQYWGKIHLSNITDLWALYCRFMASICVVDIVGVGKPFAAEPLHHCRPFPRSAEVLRPVQAVRPYQCPLWPLHLSLSTSPYGELHPSRSYWSVAPSFTFRNGHNIHDHSSRVQRSLHLKVVETITNDIWYLEITSLSL